MTSAIYSLALFVSAALLFAVQPVIARMILPKFGGTPAVWTVALLFFQVGLLAGYAYAHVLATWVGRRWQALIHLTLLAAAALALPFGVAGDWSPSLDYPVIELLALLTMTVGAPFFFLAATAPLFQRWFAATGAPGADDPYFLYAASNAGSLIGLLSYPLVVEPALGLTSQSKIWSIGYAAFGAAAALCALFMLRGRGSALPKDGGARSQAAAAPRWKWIVLAAVPSSLLLGVTDQLTNSLPPAPLIWLPPLAIYLITFIIAFSRRSPQFWEIVNRSAPVLIVLQGLVTLVNVIPSMHLGMLLLLAAFGMIALACHGELARLRPGADRLTEYYLLLTAGGALGGLFNALIAPLIFDRMIEYPFAIVAACLLLPANQPLAFRSSRVFDVAFPALLGVCAYLLLRYAAGLPPWLRVAAPLLACTAAYGRPLRLGLCLGALYIAFGVYFDVRDPVLFRTRNFFGQLRVFADKTGAFHHLGHGGTIHGLQATDPELHGVPLGYYHRTSPIGSVFSEFRGPAKARRVGFVGLGIGSLAAYGEPGQQFDFFEINPAVERIARDERYFHHLATCQADVRVILGDARIMLDREPNGAYNVIAIDAFGSGAVPNHLLTREAMQLYRRKLAPGGVVAFHISNPHVDLRTVLARLARDQRLVAWELDETVATLADPSLNHGKFPSHWIIVAARAEDFGGLRFDGRWKILPRLDGEPWTDERSNILGIIRWW